MWLAITAAGSSIQTFKVCFFIHFGLIQNESKDQEGL